MQLYSNSCEYSWQTEGGCGDPTHTASVVTVKKELHMLPNVPEDKINHPPLLRTTSLAILGPNSLQLKFELNKQFPGQLQGGKKGKKAKV